jgi:hypothetical protein
MAETGLDRFSALREVVREGRKGVWGLDERERNVVQETCYS